MKICFKCNEEKPLDSFYKHRGMSDGHLNKCIECTRLDVKTREEQLRNNPDWVEQERRRQREKYKRLNYKEKQIEWNKNKPWTKSNKYKGLSKKFKAPKGIELHHWSYKEEHIEDVFFLPRSFHKFVHKYLVLDLEFTMFRTLDGDLLDTREKHLEYLKQLREKH